ncbi:peroxiredoxin [Mediannikoviicoccus vaginalis]|uniref:peroxiredoxin n=1 Tax=Mediannikoviicoccus vaginalis TaxID=2899727 RepID=UPI001F3EC8DF|nr:peroxiredoxin [Mediannikoviicoccus vaginalis]
MNNLKDLMGEDFAKENEGKNLVIYFYPKDNTKGCTTEAIEFSENKKEFEKLNTKIYGISKDSQKSHDKFIKDHNLEIDLLTDEELELIKAFDVWKKKKMYGKEYMGVERSTFIFNKEGVLVKEYRKVKVKDHVKNVLEFVKEELND